jgi:hypothetical protein
MSAMKTAVTVTAIIVLLAVASGCGGSASSSTSCSDESYQADAPLFLPLTFALDNFNADVSDEAAFTQDARQIEDSGQRITRALREDVPCSAGLRNERELRLAAVHHWGEAARIITSGCRPGQEPCGTNLLEELKAGTSAWDRAKR